MAPSLAFPRLWPEAVVVYPQGLLTPGRLSDPQGKRAGWQKAIGAQDDRDLGLHDLQEVAFPVPVAERVLFGAAAHVQVAAGLAVFGAVVPMPTVALSRVSPEPSH